MKYLLLFGLALGILSCASIPTFQKQQAVIVNNGGSGFKIDSFICTAAHVVDDNFFASIKDYYGKEFVALVVYRDTVQDIAILKYHNPTYYQYSVSTPEVKQLVHSISNPLNLYFSEVSGEVQNLERKDEDGVILIQIGIDVYYGSSGSAVYDGSGAIVGMIVRAIPGTRFTFIVPSNQISLALSRVKR